MGSILIMRGLPGSGKTTYAKAWVALDRENRVRVSRDDIRLMMFGTADRLTNKGESLVSEVEESAVRAALGRGKDVVVDAMHLRVRYVQRWAHIAESALVEIETPIETCIARNKEREARGERFVPEGAIRELAKRFSIPDHGSFAALRLENEKLVKAVPKWKPAPEYNYNLGDAIIVDLDGTLAHMKPGGRSPYDEDRVYEDDVNLNLRDMLTFLEGDHHIIVVSGRSEAARRETERWLREKAQIEPDEVLMRKAGDKRRDDMVKAEIFDFKIAPNYNVVGVFDDRPKVLRMWRAKGLTTYNVGDGREF